MTVDQWDGGGRAPGRGGLVLRAGEADGVEWGGCPAGEVPRSAVGTDCSALPLCVTRNAAHPDSPPARLEKVFLGIEETWGSGNRGPLPGQGSGRPRASAGSSRAEAS